MIHVVCTSLKEQEHLANELRDTIETFNWGFPYSFTWVETEKGVGCAEGQNTALLDIYNNPQEYNTPLVQSTASVSETWFLVMDVDVLCNGEMFSAIAALKPDSIYGAKIHPAGTLGCKTHWIDGWIMAIPGRALEDIGMYDENFIASGFEDADYCFRAMKAGYGVKQAKFPFLHLASGVKTDITEDYSRARLANLNYLKRKWSEMFDE